MSSPKVRLYVAPRLVALAKTDFPKSTMLNSEEERRYVHTYLYIYEKTKKKI